MTISIALALVVQVCVIMLDSGFAVAFEFEEVVTPSRAVSRPLMPVLDRAIEARLKEAEAALYRSEFQSAGALLVSVLTQASDSVAQVDQSTKHEVALELAQVRAWAMTGRLSTNAREVLEAELDRRASDRWAVVRAGNTLDEIRSFSVRHRYSLPGLMALRQMAAVERDAGRHALAASAWARVAAHPRATIEQQTSANIARIESLLVAGLPDEAARLIESLRTKQLVPSIRIAGQDVSMREWLERQSRRIAEWNSIASGNGRRDDGQPATNGVLTGGPPVGVSPVKSINDALEAGPSPNALWTFATPLPNDLIKSWDRVRHSFRQQGVVSSMTLRPLVTGKVAILRTMEHLVAVDIASGATVWQEPHDEFKWIAERTAYFENTNFRNGLVQFWHRRTEADSIYGDLVSDGRCVISVMEPDRVRWQLPLNRSFGPGNPTGSGQPEEIWNLLKSHWLSNGALRWQIGGKGTGRLDVFKNCRFLGPPLSVGDQLFSMVQQDGELKLMAINGETGHLRWSRSLLAAELRTNEEPARFRVACPISLVDGLLICPTGVGVLMAIDPVMRSVVWASTYPAAEREVMHRPLNGIGTPGVVDRWWNGWREVSCLTSSKLGIAILASPESNELRALSLKDGRENWAVGRGNAIHLTAITEDSALVVEPRAVRAQDLRTGALRWRCETGEVSGRGTVVGSHLFQPRRAGGVVVIDVRDGSHRHGLTGDDVALSTLIPCEGGWISQTEESVKKLSLLGDTRREAVARWTATPDDESSARVLARLDLLAGDAAAARRRLAEATSSEAVSLRRETLFQLLKSPPSILSPEERDAFGKELLALCDSNDDRIAAHRALGESALAAHEPVVAMRWFLEGLDILDATVKRTIGEWSADEISGRSVRRDRILVGAIELAMNQGMKEHPEEIAKLLEESLVKARQNRDPFAVQRLIDRMLPLEWGRKTLISEVAAMQFARPTKQNESALLTVCQSRDPVISKQAHQHLIDLMQRSGWRSEAEAIESRWMKIHPGEELTESNADSDAPADAAEAARYGVLLRSPKDPWPEQTPRFSIEPAPLDKDVHYVPVAVDAAPGSLLARMDVAIDRQGRFVRFAGEGHAGGWKYTLPGPAPPLRTVFANTHQFEAWGVGRLLLLRVGSELFCIAPLDERGEPHAKAEWSSIDMHGEAPTVLGEPSWIMSNVPSRIGVRHEGVRLVDSFDRPIGRVGPVRPDYICFQSQARLVAIETATGRRLWQRPDVPSNSIVFGDESYVYVWRTAERSIQRLSAIDGHVIDERPWTASADDVLMQRDGMTWLAPRAQRGTASRTEASQEPNTIELHDARSGSMLWGRRFELQAIPFVIDRDTLGVVESSGLLHLLSATSGNLLAKPLQVTVPDKLERIVALFDDQRWYVALSRPVARFAQLQADQPWGGKRIQFVDGPLIAIDRDIQRIAWERRMNEEPLSLDASRMSPVFVQLWRQQNTTSPESKGTIGRLNFIDKRTGKDITSHQSVDLQPYFVLDPGPNRERLDIRSERGIFRLRYDNANE